MYNINVTILVNKKSTKLAEKVVKEILDNARKQGVEYYSIDHIAKVED